MTFLLTYYCQHRHRSVTRYAQELGREWIEDRARKACGPDSQAGMAKVPHKAGDERCGKCGSDQLVWSIESRFEDHSVTGGGV